MDTLCTRGSVVVSATCTTTALSKSTMKAKRQKWNHCTSTPHPSETNGIAERVVRSIKAGTSAVLLQSSLDEKWWADSMESYCCLRNIQDLLSEGKTPHERRFGEPFRGPVIPFVAMVEYRPISAKDLSRLLVADIEELETMDASEIYSKRLNAKEVIFLTKWKIPISSRRWTNKIYWRRSGTENIHFGTGTSNSRRKSRRFSWRVRRVSLPPPHDSFPDAGEARNDFWSISGNFINRHHVEPRVKLLLAEREESFPIPLKYIDVSTIAHTNLDVMQERRIDDYWNIDGSRDLTDYWTGFAQSTLLDEKPPEGHMWSGWRLTKRQATSRPDHLWPELWIKMGKNAKLREKHKWAIEKPKLDNARRLRGIYFIDPDDKEFKETVKKARKKLETPVAPAMPCKISKNNQNWVTRGKSNEIKSKLACNLEASESTRLRVGESLPNHHEDHIAGKGDNSLQHYNLVHKFILMPQAMKIPAAKAAVDKECEKLEKIPA